MEEILIAILAAVAELLVELFLYLPWDALFSLFERRRDHNKKPMERPIVGTAIVGAVIGGVVGALSLLAWQKTMLPVAWLRIANLVATPLASGLLARRAAERRSARGLQTSPREHFAFAASLTLAVLVVRFIQGTRPG